MPEPSSGTADPYREEMVLGLDNVQLDLPVAGLGSRSLACFLDTVLLSFLVVIWLVGSTAALAWTGVGAGWILAVVLLGLFVLNWFYFAGLEAALGGQTPGKMAVRLRVVTRQGGKPGLSALLVRNFLRPVDLLLGVPLMAVDPLARRLGDRVAGTLVTREPRGESELVLQQIPSTWGASEVSFAEALLGRLDELEPARARSLALRTLEWIERSDPELLRGIPWKEEPVLAVKRVLSPGRD